MLAPVVSYDGPIELPGYDDAATIRVYLQDSGYKDVTEEQIAKVRSYMLAHGIKHISQLGQGSNQ